MFSSGLQCCCGWDLSFEEAHILLNERSQEESSCRCQNWCSKSQIKHSNVVVFFGLKNKDQEQGNLCSHWLNFVGIIQTYQHEICWWIAQPSTGQLSPQGWGDDCPALGRPLGLFFHCEGLRGSCFRGGQREPWHWGLFQAQWVLFQLNINIDQAACSVTCPGGHTVTLTNRSRVREDIDRPA